MAERKQREEKKRKLRVLQLGKQYYPHIGGIENTMQQIAEGIQGKVDSYVLASQEKGPAHQEIINQVPVYYAKSWGIVSSMPLSWDLICYLCRNKRKYDIIQLHMPFPLGDLALFLSGYKGKLVLFWHSDIVRQKKAMLLYWPLMKWTLHRADAIAIATQGNIDGSPYVKPFENKCVKVPFGLRKEWEEKSDLYWENRHLTEQRDKAKLKLLFIGRLVYYKGCDVLIKAMEELKRESEVLQDIELWFVGTGVLESALKERVRNAGLEKNVFFAGKVTDEILQEKVQESDVLVFPSVANSEAFGLVQLEAMAFGKPVINTALPTGVPWVSLDGETGITVPPGEVKALSDAILWMKENPDEREEMGKKARERVKTEFTQKKMMEKLLRLYKELWLKK